jgi:glutaredoxin
MIRLFCVAMALTLLTSVSASAEESYQSTLSPVKAAEAKKYPQIVLYSVAWCPHCRNAKEYLTNNSIPFINRDVEIDTKALEELSVKYNSTGVPVIVFSKGNDEVVMKGFTPERFQENLNKLRSK